MNEETIQEQAVRELNDAGRREAVDKAKSIMCKIRYHQENIEILQKELKEISIKDFQ